MAGLTLSQLVSFFAKVIQVSPFHSDEWEASLQPWTLKPSVSSHGVLMHHQPPHVRVYIFVGLLVVIFAITFLTSLFMYYHYTFGS